MKRYQKKVVCFAIGCLGLLTACGLAEKKAANVPAGWSLVDHTEAFFEVSSVSEMRSFLASRSALSRHYFDIESYASDSLLALGLYSALQNPHLDTLRQEVTHAYPLNGQAIQQSFQKAFQQLIAFDPNFQVPKIEWIVAGLYKDVYFSDSLLIIGLDYFLGPDARYPPIGLPQYMTRRYTPAHLVPLYLSYVAQKYNTTDPTNQSLLADMIAMGKNYCFVQAMLPSVADTIVTGYTEQELKDVSVSRALIWSRFIENEWLFETNHFVKEKLIGDRPRVYEIGDRCPGRIGYWLGWDIVKAYQVRHPEVSIGALMAQKDVMALFNEARYRP